MIHQLPDHPMLPPDTDSPMDNSEIVQAARVWITKLLAEDFTIDTDSDAWWYCGASAYGFEIASNDEAHFFDKMEQAIQWYVLELVNFLNDDIEDIVNAYIEWREY